MNESIYIKRAREIYWQNVEFLSYARLGSSEFDSRYRWNPELGGTGRYIDKDGKIVSSRVIVSQLEKVITGVQTEMVALTLDLEDKKITTQQWYDGVSKNIKSIHGLSASLSKGGWAQMEDNDWQLVKDISKEQLGYFNDFARDLDTGNIPLDGNVLRRVNQYIAAGRSTAEEMKRHVMLEKATHEKRLLGPADHCRTQDGLLGCWELFKLGWQPIGTLPKIGETPCYQNCHCKFIFGIMTPDGVKIIK